MRLSLQAGEAGRTLHGAQVEAAGTGRQQAGREAAVDEGRDLGVGQEGDKVVGG